MNIDCEIGIRGDTCQRSALSLGCRQAWGRYRCATVACRHSSALKAATFPLYLPGEACLPFTGLIFLLEPLTIYSLPPPLPPPGIALSLISSSFFFALSVWLCLSFSFFLLFVSLQYTFLSCLFLWPSPWHKVLDMTLPANKQAAMNYRDHFYKDNIDKMRHITWQHAQLAQTL